MHEEIELVGRLTADPTMRYTASGVPVTSISIATSKKLPKAATPQCPDGWKDGYKGKHWELTKFWRITAWRGLAESTNQFLQKGRMVFIKGELGGDAENGICNPRVWEGKDGMARANYEVTARVIRFLGGREENGAAPDAPPPGFGEEASSIPF